MNIVVADLGYSPVLASPEHILWMAVIERAILDYVWPTNDLNVAFRNNLIPFFFSDVPKKHNLVYICENLFDYPDAVKVIRKRLMKLKTSDISEEEFIRCKRYKGYY